MNKELITNEDPKSPISEVFKSLRTNIQFMADSKGLKTVLVTSSMPGEGKSWVSSNLAVAFAQEGKKILLVDSDMRKGRVHKILGVEKKPGLSNYLSGISELEEGKNNIISYIKITEIKNLCVLPAGEVPPNPSELLVSQKATNLIKELGNIFDLVIFDGTPCLLVTDAIILARQIDTTVIVTAYNNTKLNDVDKIKKSIENVGGKVAGIVINRIPIPAKEYRHQYYYGNEKEEEKSKAKLTKEGKRIRQEKREKQQTGRRRRR